jgi:hypothetical protein
MNAPHSLGEVWDDTIDPVLCRYGGYGMKNYSKSIVQWLTEAGQYKQSTLLEKRNLKKKLSAVPGLKDLGGLKLSGNEM